MTTRFTIALRICVNCQRQFGVSLWPWSGATWTRTHGICRPCRAQLSRAPADEPASQKAPAAPSAL